MTLSYIVLRWNSLESDVTTAKRFVSHIALPMGLAALHRLKDACCSRHPKPGMRPPSLPPRVATQTNDSTDERPSENTVSN